VIVIARIAAGLARSSEPEHRWRRTAVPVAAAIFMLLALAGSSVVSMARRETGRMEQRTALLAVKPSPTDLILRVNDDVWRGEQYLVAWIEPAGGTSPVLPPGIERLPEPGQAVVTPALDRMASRSPALAARYPDRLILGPEGVGGGDELLAYVRWPKGRRLHGDLAGELSGDTRAVRVRAFGAPAGAARSLPLEPPAPMAPAVAVLEAALGLLVVPGLIVLAAGTAAASGVRERRFEVLRWIGASRRTLVALSVLETSILALPGLAAAAILWSVVAPRLERVPLVGHDVVRGDLGLPWWVLATESCAGLLVTGLLSIALTAVRRRREPARPRPASGRIALTPLRAAPLGAALAALALGRIVGGSAGATLSLAGIVAIVVGVPLVLPGALRAVGVAVGRLEPVAVSLAGRGLEWDPVRATRPFAGAAALIVLALSGSGYVALNRHVEETAPPAAGTHAVLVEWPDPHPRDPDRLASALREGLVAPLGEGEHAHSLVVGSTCRRIAPYLPGSGCDPEAPYGLPRDTERRLAGMLAFAAQDPDAEIRLAPASEVAPGSALVLDDAPLGVLEESARTAAMRTLPAPSVHSQASSVAQESPLVAWIVGGLATAAVALAAACLISLVDRLLDTHGHRRHLLNMGVTSGGLATLEALLFAVPYGTIVVVGFSVGLAVCVLLVGLSDVSMPWREIGAILGLAVAAGLAGTASVALLGARSIRENPE
jgi:hypothetical protein